MEVKISNLYNRFNFFSYSAFQKYKNDKCNNKPLFSCKKDLYMYLENMYKLEFLSRKKLFNVFDETDFLILSLVLKEEHVNDLANFSTNILNDLIKEDNITNIFDIVKKNLSEMERLKYFLKISNQLNSLKSKNNWSELDEFIFFQILYNLKRFHTISDYYPDFFDITDISKNILTIFPNNEDSKVKLIFTLKNQLEIYEEENINNKPVKTKLKEPKWLLKSSQNKYSYMDHKFNFLTLELENRKIFYNGIRILGSEKIFELNEKNKTITFKIIEI